MRIALVCPLISSSSFITTYPYAKILSEEHDVTIIGPTLGDEPYIKDDSLNYEFVEPPIRKPANLALASMYWKMKKKLRDGEYDVIHAFKLFPNTAAPAAAVKDDADAKLVVTVDDYDTVSSKNPLKRAVLKWAEGARHKTDQMIVSSSTLQEIYGGEIIYQVANEPLFLEGNSNGDRIREKYGLEDKRIILYAGTIFEHKGIHRLIEAVQHLDHADVKLVVAGYGDTDIVERLAGDETIFIGRVGIDEVPDLIDAADIYAVPTESTPYSEAQIPGKIFEPMMMGCPVLATAVSDVPEILDYGKAGMIVQPGSAQVLTTGLETLLNDDSLRRKLGERAKERYMEKYCYEKMAEKIRRVYARLEE